MLLPGLCILPSRVVHPPQSILRQVSTAKKKGQIPRHRPWFRYNLKGNRRIWTPLTRVEAAGPVGSRQKIKKNLVDNVASKEVYICDRIKQWFDISRCKLLFSLFNNLTLPQLSLRGDCSFWGSWCIYSSRRNSAECSNCFAVSPFSFLCGYGGGGKVPTPIWPGRTFQHQTLFDFIIATCCTCSIERSHLVRKVELTVTIELFAQLWLFCREFDNLPNIHHITLSFRCFIFDKGWCESERGRRWWKIEFSSQPKFHQFHLYPTGIWSRQTDLHTRIGI